MFKNTEYQFDFDETKDSIHQFYWRIKEFHEEQNLDAESSKKILDDMLDDLIIELICLQDGFDKYPESKMVH